MSVALWIVQGLLALVMIASGLQKVALSRDKYAERMKWAASWSGGKLKLLGVAEALGAVGLVAPWVTGTGPFLTPCAAVCLLLIVVGAVKTHVDLKDSITVPAVLGALCAFVALGRFGAF